MKNTLKIIFAISFFVSGCHCYTPCWIAPPAVSQVPVPGAYPLSMQYKMQAMHHWSLLAGDITDRIKKKLETGNLEFKEPVYVIPSGTTPFEKAFRELLITRFVEKGIFVTDDLNSRILLNVDVQTVFHRREIIRTKAGVYKSLAPGLFVKRNIPLAGRGNRLLEVERSIFDARLNVEAGAYTVELPKTEIMITTSLTSENDYLMRYSAIYYIDDSEWRHYKHKSSRTHRRTAVVNYGIVDK